MTIDIVLTCFVECLCSAPYHIKDNNSDTSYTSNLTLNKVSLSSYRRKLTSVPDFRTSSRVIGTFGILNIAMVLLVIVVLDCNNMTVIFRFLKSKFHVKNQTNMTNQ